MRPRRWNEIFALFFDPSVPLAFVLGSLALAIAGSALYQLLTVWIGTGVASQAWLLAGSLAVVLAAVLLLRQTVYFWIRRQGKGRLIVPPDQQARPHKALILPIGLSPTGAEGDIIAFHARNGTLRHCWLLGTPQVDSKKLSDLCFQVQEANAEYHQLTIANSFDMAESYAAARDALEAARHTRNAWPAIVDITGGTAVMSAGLALAAREQGVAVQYYPARHDSQTGKVDTRSGSAPQLVAFVSGSQGGTP